MIAQLFTIIAPIAVCAAIGFAWCRFNMPYDGRVITRLVTMIGAPCLIFSTFMKFEVAPETVGEVALAALCAVAIFAAISVIALRLARLPANIYLPPLTFANAGNMGLPLCLFAFGDTGLALAIGYFAVTATLHYGFGAWIYSGRASPTEAFKTPLPYVAVLSAVLLAIDVRPPEWIFNTTNLLGGLTIPLMLIALGASLKDLVVTQIPRSLALGLFRVGMGVGVGVALAELFGFEGLQRGVVIIEASMPAAVFNYLLAAHYERAPEEAASVVVASTLIAFVALPFILMLALAP
ncbi:MAG: AEC family transporter [Alphaproteobacteria bacterium]